MSAIVELPLSIPEPEVVRLLGYPEGRQPPAAIHLSLQAALEEARALAMGRGAWCTLPVSRSREVGLEPLAAEVLVLGVATIGGAIEARVTACLEGLDRLGALFFDAAGSAAAEEAADRLGAAAIAALGAGRDAATEVAPHLSCRVSPGYGRWKLAAQPALLAHLPCDDVGVRLLPSHFLMPRKSVSFAMWLGAGARPLEGLSGCSRCELPVCRYRK